MSWYLKKSFERPQKTSNGKEEMSNIDIESQQLDNSRNPENIDK